MPACGAFYLRKDEEVMGMLILGAVLALLAAGCLSVRQRLAAARENVRSAMGQACLRLASGFDALEGLLDRIADSAPAEAARVRQKLAARRAEAEGKADVPVLEQNVRLLSETSVSMLELALQSTDEPLRELADDAACCLRMLRTGCLIYNDCADKYNRLLERFPAKIVGRLLGFRKEETLNNETIDGLIRQGITECVRRKSA